MTTPDIRPAASTSAGTRPVSGATVTGLGAGGGEGTALWKDDTGTLREQSRRVLLELLKGPYVSGAQKPGLWSALVADEAVIRSRLHDLFLDLVMDPTDEFAFIRKVQTPELDVPSSVRSERLPFIDTAMLLVLRQILLASPGDRRVIVSQDEVYERLSVYHTGDAVSFQRNLNAAWNRMKNKLRILHSVGEDRMEISPVVKFLVDEDRVRELTDVYRRLATDAAQTTDSEETVSGEITTSEEDSEEIAE